MREHTIKLFTFNELSPEAQEKAIQHHRENAYLDAESMTISEGFMEVLYDKGYPTDNLEWSLNHCQGDGVAFYGWVDIKKVGNRLLEGRQLDLFNAIQDNQLSLDANIARNTYGYHYSHWNTMRIEMDGDDIETMIEYLYPEIDNGDSPEEFSKKYREIEELIEHLEKAILSDVQSTSRELERSGYESFDYYYSDEYIKESLEDGYEFTADGKTHY